MRRKIWQASFSLFLLTGFISGLVQPVPAQAVSTDQQPLFSTAPLGIKSSQPLQEGNPPKDKDDSDPGKSEEATSEGSGVQALWPGPDGYKYQGSSCTYSWVDITSTGTAITGLTDDSSAGPFNIGFTFPFYESSFTQFFANSNGFLSFGSGSTSLNNQCPLPNATTPNNIIAMLWDDLNFNTSGNAYYQNFGSCPVGSGACTVVEYYNVARYGDAAGSAGTWEVILYPDASVMMQFLDSGVEAGFSSTTGIENNNAASGYGLTYACNADSSVADNTCIVYTRPAMPNLSKSSKVVPALASPGDLLEYTVSVKNTGNADGTDTTMVDPIPVGTTFDHAVTPDLVYNPSKNQVEWTGDVAIGSNVDLTFVVEVDAGAGCGVSITNTAVISHPATLAPVEVKAVTNVSDRIFLNEKFENNNGGFTTSGMTSWAWGTVGPYIGTRPDFPAGAHSGTKAWATNLTGDYNVNEDGYITSPAIDLSLAVHGYPLKLEWWQWLRTEGGYDYASVEVRGGSIPWTKVYGPVSGIIDLGWMRHVVDISAFTGSPDFQVRFHFTSDYIIIYPGWYVDDFAIHQCGIEAGSLQGYVYDYTGIDPTVTPAKVHLDPGDIEIPVDTSGFYSALIAPNTYQATASAVDYPIPDGPVSVVVVNNSVTTQDFVLDRPDIDVNPTSLSVAIVADGTATRYFTVTNEGTLPLLFEIREAQAAAVASAMSDAVPSGTERSKPTNGQIEVESELITKLDLDGSTGYLIYFKDRPDLSAAFGMDWISRGRFVVKALQETAERSQAKVRAYLDAQGASYKSFWIDNLIVVEVSNRSTFDGLMTFPEIAALRARRTMGLIMPEVDPLAALNQVLGIEPNITHVGADQVWSQGFTGQGIVVANIDTGVRYTHSALVGHYRGNLGGGTFNHNYNWLDPYGDHPTSPADDNGHGSHTMGTMVGDDGGANQIGMAPGAKWMACRGCSTSACTDAALLGCAQFMANPTDLAGANPNPDLRPNAINNSWGDCGRSYDNWYQGVVNSWHAAGIYPIFSNGNASNCGYPAPPGLNTVGNPARYGNVSGVGSSGQSNGQYATHSNWGPTDNLDTVNPHPGWANIKPQFLAPGVNIRSSVNTGDTAYQGGWSGTSMSAPHVTGLVALMWSAAPCLVGDYAATETIIENTATPISYNDGGGARFPNFATGWGEINAVAAVDAAMQYCGTDFLPWVSFSPITGTVASETSQLIEATFTCGYTESLETQPLEGVLHVNHDDPEQPNPRDVQLSMYCIPANPVPMWDKEVHLNGAVVDYTAGPLVVRPDDIVTVVDWVGATYSVPVSADLYEFWGDSLTLIAADTDGVGTLYASEHSVTWELDDVAPNIMYPITKTFAVLYGTWTVDTLHESFTVQDAVNQLPDKNVEFEQYVPALALAKDGPSTAISGSTIPITLTITSLNFGGEAVLTDTLPTGMMFAGDLEASYGEAWVVGNVVYWTNVASTVGLLDAPEEILLTEGFEGGVVPPTGWTKVQNNPSQTWKIATSNPHTGSYNADVVYDPALVQQNEWLLSPSMGLTQGTLSFWSFGSLYWCRDTYDNCDLNVWIVVGPTAGDGDDILVGTADDDWSGAWTWSQSTFDLTPLLPGGPVRIGFQYYGLDGAQIGLDDVQLDGSTNPPMPGTVTITFDVTVSGDRGDVIRNTAILNWSLDWTKDILDVLIIEGWKFFLPVILNAP